MDRHTKFLFRWLPNLLALPRCTSIDKLFICEREKKNKIFARGVLTLLILLSAHILKGKHYLQACNPC